MNKIKIFLFRLHEFFLFIQIHSTKDKFSQFRYLKTLSCLVSILFV